jgi:hypothetical protein
MGTRLNKSSNRQHETDGLKGHVNSTFQKLLRHFRYYDGSKWTAMLPQVNFAYHATSALEIEHTSFEANFFTSGSTRHVIYHAIFDSNFARRDRAVKIVTLVTHSCTHDVKTALG